MSETADAALGEAEYRAIESTFGETAHGRRFLAEFARRSRKADIASLMTAMDRLREGGPSRPEGEIERLKASLAEIAAVLEEETNALEPAGFEGLAATLREAESATSDILDAAEHIQEVAWTLRERGADRGICDLLDGRSSEIYAACALHDAAVKRIGRSLRAGRVLEERLASLCDEWGIRKPASEAALAAQEHAPTSAGEDIGDVPVEDGAPDAPAEPAEETPAVAAAPEPPASESDVAPESAPEMSASSRRRQQLAALAEIDSLGIREKLKLFT